MIGTRNWYRARLVRETTKKANQERAKRLNLIKEF